MHEMGIAREVIEIAEASIPQDMKTARIEQVNLKIGKLAAVVPASLKFCYEVLTKNTPLAGSILHIEEIPVMVRCNACAAEWTAETPAFTCPACRGKAVTLISGKELEIVSIEISDDSPTLPKEGSHGN